MSAVAILAIAASPALPASARPVTSLLETRRSGVVVQRWDISCGAAALATLLNYQFGDPVSEREVAAGLIRRSEYLANPALVRARLGFSLLDLQRFAETRGYRGIGYGRLDPGSLPELAPVIVPVRLLGYRHFVVYRGQAGNRVLLADPAFGNRTMLAARFARAWIDDPRLGRIGFVVRRADGTGEGRLAPRQADFVMVN